MAKTNVELSKILTDRKSVEDLYGQLERLTRELDRVLRSLEKRIEAVEKG